jgi:hypothetical protein
MTTSAPLDAAGRRRSPATLPSFHRGRPPRNKGQQYPADPPTVEEIVAVMRRAGDGAHGLRARALIVLLWRAGLRISEALSLAESDLDATPGSVLVRRNIGRQAPRSRHGRLGLAAPRRLDRRSRRAADRRAAVRHRRTPGGRSPTHNAGSMRVIGSAVDLAITRISNTPTRGSPPSTSKVSTARKSSTPSTAAPPQSFPPAPDSASEARPKQRPGLASRTTVGWRPRRVGRRERAAQRRGQA